MGVKNSKFMIKAKGLVAVVLTFSCTLFLFQNCDPGFNSHRDSSLAPLPATSELQVQSFDIITRNCKSCHVDQALGGVSNLLDYSHLINSGLVVPGDVASRLLASIDNNSMPPSGALSETEKRTIRNWILALGGLTPDLRPIDFAFDFSISTSPQLFQVRMDKLNYVMGNSGLSSINQIQNNRFLLGDYNFAQTIIPNFSWGVNDTKTWMENINDVCSSQELRDQYPWPSGVPNLVFNSMGRSIDSDESSMISEVNNLSIPNNEKFEIMCLALLSSMEFITK